MATSCNTKASIINIFFDSFKVIVQNPKIFLFFLLLTVVPFLGVFPFAIANIYLTQYGRVIYGLGSVLLSWPLAILYNFLIIALYLFLESSPDRRSLFKSLARSFCDYKFTLVKWSLIGSALFVGTSTAIIFVPNLLVSYSGFFVILGLFIILLTVLFNFFLLFAPVIITTERTGILDSMKRSFYYLKNNIKLTLLTIIIHVIFILPVILLFCKLIGKLLALDYGSDPGFSEDILPEDSQYFIHRSLLTLFALLLTLNWWYFFHIIKYYLYKQITNRDEFLSP